jgi:hypothetical protein
MVADACNPALRRLRNENYQFKASLGYIESETVSKKAKKENHLNPRFA